MALTERDIQDLREKLRQKMKEAGTLDRLPTEGRSDRRARAAADKPWFLRFYCPHYFPYEFTSKHIRALHHCDLLNQLYFLMAFRGWGKSAIGTFGDPLYKIYQETRRFLLIASINEDVATLFTVALKLEIEENPRLRQDYGDLRGQSDWSESEFTTRNNRKVLARGYRSKYRGLRFGPYRPDDATVDDWEDDDTAENPEQCTKRMNRIWKAIRPAMQRQKDGGYSLKYIGTPLTTDSVTWQLWKDETRQIVKDRIPIVDKHGKPTWPEVYTQTEIDAIRLDSGLTAWHSEYLLDPLPSGERDFREEWICYVEKLPRLVQPITYGAVDPSATSSGDPKAVITLTGDRAAMKIYTRHAFIRKASPKELCKAIHEQQEIYDCDYAIEENGLKDYLWEAVELYEKDHHVHLRLRPVHHGSEISKQNRIRKLQSPIERRLIAFQRGHSDQDELVKQLLAFPSKSVHDDGPDALEEAYQQIMRRMRGASTEQLEAEGERETAELSARYTNFEGY